MEGEATSGALELEDSDNLCGFPNVTNMQACLKETPKCFFWTYQVCIKPTMMANYLRDRLSYSDRLDNGYLVCAPTP